MKWTSHRPLGFPRPSRWVLLALATSVVIGVVAWQWTAAQDRGAQKKQPFRQYVERGSEGEAREYYAAIQEELGFPRKAAIALEPSLDQLLEYVGYKGLKAEDLERLPSEVVMDPRRLAESVSNPKEFEAFFQGDPIQPDDILCTRFVSPKSTDVAGPAEDREYTWRKVLRLRSRRSSEAAQKGIVSLFVLFNFVEKDLNKSPFGDDTPNGPPARAKNMQAILVRGKDTRLKSPLYWMLFDPLTRGGRRTTYLTASWDVPVSAAEGPERYYVPSACAQCHGDYEVSWKEKGFPNGMLNYIDTDHLFDRIRDGDDFERLGKSKLGVLYDGGPDPNTDQFRKAFDVIRKLNEEVYQQNKLVDEQNQRGPAGYFMTQAVEHWLRLHQDNPKPVPLFRRSLPSAKGVVWDETKNPDKELLPLLNQYCFRCHTSVVYHVFDKEAVVSRLPRLKNYVGKSQEMPQDRPLTDAQRKRFVELFEQLEKQK